MLVPGTEELVGCTRCGGYGRMQCPACDGWGRQRFRDDRDCGLCHGNLQVFITQTVTPQWVRASISPEQTLGNGSTFIPADCPQCGGAKILTCAQCNGHGKMWRWQAVDTHWEVQHKQVVRTVPTVPLQEIKAFPAIRFGPFNVVSVPAGFDRAISRIRRPCACRLADG